MKWLCDNQGKPLRTGSPGSLLTIPGSLALPGTPTYIMDVTAQTDLTANEYNVLQDGSGNGYDFAYESGGKAQKSSALQLDGVDTLLTVNNGFNDGTMYRSAAGIDLAGEFFPNSGVGTIMAVLAPKAYKHFFASVDFIWGGSSVSFQGGFSNTTHYPRVASNAIVASASPALTLDTYYVLTQRFNGSEIRGQVDNGTEFTQTGDARVGLTDRAQLFFNGGSAGCFEGYVRWLVFWPEFLSAGDVSQAKAYFKYASPSLNV